MREVTVRKEELLAKVRANRKTHIEDFNLACKGYRDKALAKIDRVMGDLRGQIEQLKEGETINLMSVSFGLPVPVSHEKDYDQVIAMLEMSTEDTLKVSADEFACYVMDDWDWKADFLVSNRAYGLRK